MDLHMWISVLSVEGFTIAWAVALSYYYNWIQGKNTTGDKNCKNESVTMMH